MTTLTRPVGRSKRSAVPAFKACHPKVSRNDVKTFRQQPSRSARRSHISRRVPLVGEAVFGGVALLAEHPIGLAVAEKHCLPESW